MVNDKDTAHLSNREPRPEDPAEQASHSRRDAVTLLFGAFGTAVGASALAGCEAGGTRPALPQSITSSQQALLATSTVETLNDLRAVSPPSGPTWVTVDRHGPIVGGNQTDFKVGGGLFRWDPQFGPGSVHNPAELAKYFPEAENDGTMIKPNAIAANESGRWLRVFDGPISVHWFGAVGDSVTDDSLPIQRALNTCQATYGPHDMSGVWLPNGTYSIQTTLVALYGSKLFGEGNSCITGPDTIPLLRIGAQGVTIQDIAFNGGRNSIALYGPSGLANWPNLDPTYCGNTPCRISRCAFYDAKGPAIWQDVSVSYRTFQSSLFVEDYHFRGVSLFWGAGDEVLFSRGTIEWDARGSIPQGLDSEGFPLGCLNSYSVLTVSDCRISVMINAQSKRPSFFVGTGMVYLTNCVAGDVIGICVVRNKGLTNKCQGFSLPLDPGVRLSLTWKNNLLTWVQGANWLEIYESLPTLVEVDDSNYPHMQNSLGIWIHESVDLSSALEQHTFSQLFRLAGSDTARPYTIRSSSEANALVECSSAVTQLTEFFGAHRERTPYGDYECDSTPQNNLSTPGVYKADQMVVAGSPVTWNGVDATTGYQLPVMTFSDDSNWSYFGIDNWGTGLPAGTYTFSVYLKSNKPACAIGHRNSGDYVSRTICSSDAFQRIWFSFYWPGSGAAAISLRFSLWRIQAGTNLVVGLPAVHRGYRPAPYTFPVDSAVTPTSNVTLGRITTNYYATAAPVNGTYFVGDMVWNTAPAPNSPVGWVCTAASSPGPLVFMPFGPIFNKFQTAAAAPTSGTYAVGDIVWNRTPVRGASVGWVCTNSNPFTFRPFGLIS